MSYSVVAAFSSLCILQYGLRIIYRVWFSPLAKFPGPKIAAMTSLYEFYFDFFKHATYCFEIERMHKTYGPIVRINPRELSIVDPNFYDKLYVAGSMRRTQGYSQFASGIGFEDTFFLSHTHELHRRRRKPIEPYFSRLGVSKVEPLIYQCVTKLLGRFSSFEGTGRIIRLDHAMLAFSGDVIGNVCVESPTALIDEVDFSPHWYNLQHSMIKCIPLFTEFPWLIHVVRRIPSRLLLGLDPKAECFNVWKLAAEKHIAKVIEEKEQHPAKLNVAIGGRPTLFRYLVHESGLPKSDLTIERLTKEAQILLGAGSVSTARTLHFIIFYLLTNKHMRKRLEDELEALMANWPEEQPSWTQLEKLPYLQAIIKEGLRHSYGTMHRLPRISPDEALQYTSPTDSRVWTIPAGMTRNFVPFARGSRNCIGMNLAMAEINLMVAALFRKGGIKFDLYETDESDIVAVHDYIVPLARLDSKGVRVIFK